MTILDVQNGYWQIELDESSKEKSAFSPAPGIGHFEFNVRLFGLSNAPSTYQKLMDRLLEGMPGSMAYLDNLLIYSNCSEQHCCDLKKVLTQLHEFG